MDIRTRDFHRSQRMHRRLPRVRHRRLLLGQPAQLTGHAPRQVRRHRPRTPCPISNQRRRRPHPQHSLPRIRPYPSKTNNVASRGSCVLTTSCEGNRPDAALPSTVPAHHSWDLIWMWPGQKNGLRRGSDAKAIQQCQELVRLHVRCCSFSGGRLDADARPKSASLPEGASTRRVKVVNQAPRPQA